MLIASALERKSNVRPDRARSRFLTSRFCFLLVAVWLLPATARAATSYAESGLFVIDAATNCGESGLFTINNGNCGESGMFTIDNRDTNPDLDRDGDVDLDDLAILQACSFGPGIPCPSDCLDVDLDQDGDGDQDDFSIFQRCYSGANNPVNSNCGG